MKKLGIKKIIFIVLGITILLGVSIYFLVFYNKTIVYKCSKGYTQLRYSNKRLNRKYWSCKLAGIYKCKNCTVSDNGDDYIFFMQLRDGEKKDFVNSYDYVIFNTSTKEQIATIEKASPGDFSPLVYNDGKLVALKLIKYDAVDGSGHSIIYNLNQNKETVALTSARGFHSRKYAVSLSEYKILNSEGNEVNEDNIANNLIITTEAGGNNDSIFDYLKFGLTNIETGEVVIPVENKVLYRTTYGNFIGIIDTPRSPIISLYNAKGELKYQQGLLLPNPAFVVEDAGDDYILVDNLIDYNSKYFELMDYNGNKVSNSKIYWSDIISELLKKIKQTEYYDKYANIDDLYIMEAYKTGTFKINCSYDENSSFGDKLEYITFSLFDAYDTKAYKPLIASITYEFNMTKNTLKKID